jgi:DNA-binding transcriptional MerR regulator
MMEKHLDKEWIYLISEAKRMGIPIDEVRKFLQRPATDKKLVTVKE